MCRLVRLPVTFPAGVVILLRLRVYFSHGEFIELYTSRLVDCDEIREIISRLEVVTTGCRVIGLCH